MRTRYFVLVVLVLVLLGGFAGGVYAYDKARADQIAAGVTVGGIPIGGLTPIEARAKLDQQILQPLRRPLVIRYRKTKWRLTARKAKLRTDLDATVDEALVRSRKGNLLERAWREFRGEKVEASLEPNVTYSDAAITRVLRKVRHDLERAPKDATVNISAGGVTSTPSSTGLKVRAGSLHRAMARAIVRPESKRTFVAKTTTLKPKVSTQDLTRKYGTVLIVNRGAFRLTLYKGLKVRKVYPIAVGQAGLETPAGLYHIANKAVNPAWHVPNSPWAGDLAGKVISGDDPSNPIKARWLGVYDGVGVHGTSDDGSIGSAASHGCIRMHIPDVVELYPEVPVGAPIYIA